jgi:hypothetical protein
VRATLAMQDPSLGVTQAAPVLPQYERLREALARYGVLASHAAWQAALPPLPRSGTALKAGPTAPLYARARRGFSHTYGHDRRLDKALRSRVLSRSNLAGESAP